MPRPSLRLPRPAMAAPLIALVTLLSLLSARPASAHGDTIHLEITGNAEGRLTVAATWDEDHHPVEEKIAATLQATAADGRQVGPWPLTALDTARGTYTVAVPLPPGTWQISAESAFPAMGAGKTTLKVTAVPGRPAPTTAVTTTPPPTTAPTAGPSAAQPTAAADPGKDGSSSTLLITAIAAAVVSAATAALLIIRRRRSGPQR
ncbi:hypothetical protein [Streptomyces sp. H39-S7]|uniref:hypothetical protein n=1 Tax=Streptomyces sp. H39-S7 TaxID=3004357 RepID=UPI0022AF1311|nr:hypothetical protein [Streptomyces sp. H39-S7]MCZ4119634.1 hypothetical protein [Streptomyces sp. H39-S7]